MQQAKLNELWFWLIPAEPRDYHAPPVGKFLHYHAVEENRYWLPIECIWTRNGFLREMTMSSSCQTLTSEPCLLHSQPVINKFCTWGCHAVTQIYQNCKEAAMMHSGKEQSTSHFFSSSFHPMTWWQHHIIQFYIYIFFIFLLLVNVGLVQRKYECCITFFIPLDTCQKYTYIRNPVHLLVFFHFCISFSMDKQAGCMDPLLLLCRCHSPATECLN